MSLYNMINGVNPCAFLFLPMLGKHPNEYPRFRDCFLKDSEHPEYDNHIHVYTRVGGNNRGCGYGEDELSDDPHFVTSFDDSFDNTYATYVFRVPDEWKEDFAAINEGRLADVSPAYQERMAEVFPKLKEQFTKLFEGADGEVSEDQP